MMYRKKHNGFTLVEIVVVICISTIVFAMIGSLIVFSMKMFASGVEDVQDSISISSLQDFLKSELEYATDIKIQEEKPDGEWRSFAFQEEDKVLVQSLEKEDNSIQVLNNFENFGSLEGDITFIQVSLVNSTSTNDSYAKIKLGDTTSYIIALNNASVSTANYTLQGNMKLYYRTEIQLSSITTDDSSSGDDDSTTTSEVDEDFENTGTIVDQISTISPESNRGKWEDIKNLDQMYFYQYDAIFIDGYWWVLVDGGSNNYTISSLPPINGYTKWKKLCTQWDMYSAYEAGDIVEYNGEYYQAKKDIINVGSNAGETTIYYPTAGNQWWNPGYWEKITELPEDGAANLALRDTKNEKAKNTVIKKILEYTNEELLQVKQYSAELLDEIPVCEDPDNPELDEIWMLKEKDEETGSVYFSYYIRVYTYGVGPGEKTSSGKMDWQKLSVDYSDYSVYFKGDISYYGQRGMNQYMICLKTYDTYYDRSNGWTAPFYFDRWQAI